MSLWQRLQPSVMVVGPIGGDSQISEAYSARWARSLRHGVDPAADVFPREPSLWAVVDCAYYGAADEYTYHHVEVRYELTVCTDPDRPYDTELKSWDIYDGDIDSDEYDDVNISDERIRGFAENDEEPEDEWWNTAAETEGSPEMTLAVTG